jgi:hypothetical protein
MPSRGVGKRATLHHPVGALGLKRGPLPHIRDKAVTSDQVPCSKDLHSEFDASLSASNVAPSRGGGDADSERLVVEEVKRVNLECVRYVCKLAGGQTAISTLNLRELRLSHPLDPRRKILLTEAPPLPPLTDTPAELTIRDSHAFDYRMITLDFYPITFRVNP